MAAQPRVGHPGNLRMTLQKFRGLQSVGHMPLHAQTERLQPLQQQERIERGLARADVAQDLDPGFGDERTGAERCELHAVIGGIRLGEVGEPPRSGPVEIAAVDDHAADGCAVAADELGGGMQHDVRAPFEWPAEIGRGEGVVYHQRDARLARDGRNFRKRKHVDARIAERFPVKNFRVRTDRPAEILRVGGIHERHLDPQPRKGVVELVVGSAVER